jgi:hypothetical protein
MAKMRRSKPATRSKTAAKRSKKRASKATSPENQAWKLYRELVERAWNDPAFLKSLRDNPKATLQNAITAAGVEIALPNQVKLIEDTAKVANFTVPVEGKIIC